MKRSRLIAFLLSALMVLSVAATGVFALDETGAPEPAGEVNGEAVLDAPAPADNDSATVDKEDVTVDEEVTPAPAEDEAVPAAKSVSAEELRFTAKANGKEIVLTWNKEAEDVDKITQLAYKKAEDAGAEFKVENVTGTDGEKTVSGLEYATKYHFELRLEDGTVVAEADEITAEEPAPAPTTLYAYPAYHSVYLKWDPSTNATKYVLYRDGAVVYEGGATEYTDTNNAADTTYSYYVVASNDKGASPASNVASAARVRTCYYKITFKKAVKLTSHDGTKTNHTFPKGLTVYADGFSQGKYQFDYEGHRYHAKWMRIKSPSGNYSRNAYENGVTPTLYVNQTGYGSPTGYLIWISLYSQRVYVFQGSAGNWTLVQNWQCGSGKAKTPTPTGMNKSLHKKMKKYSKHKWWNCFSGNNAIHGSNGQKEIKKLGKLISNGCVRVTNEQAIWIFNTVPKKTRVLVF